MGHDVAGLGSPGFHTGFGPHEKRTHYLRHLNTHTHTYFLRRVPAGVASLHRLVANANDLQTILFMRAMRARARVELHAARRRSGATAVAGALRDDCVCARACDVFASETSVLCAMYMFNLRGSHFHRATGGKRSTPPGNMCAKTPNLCAQQRNCPHRRRRRGRTAPAAS